MEFILRVELYDKDSLPKNIINNIKNVNKHLGQIMQNIVQNMHGWKYLHRCEESISTIDETKQIRRITNYSGYKTHHIEFRSHNMCIISIDDWKMFGKLLEIEINEIIRAHCDILLICDITSDSDY
jgi:hypothetical protein